MKKARQRLYHLRQLRKFSVSPAILKTFYSGAIESLLTQCISVWYGNISNQDCKALQRAVRLAERISGSAIPSLQDIYLKHCKSRAAKIIKDSNHPDNRLFFLLPCLHILLAHLCLYYYLLSPQYTVLHIVLYLILIFSYYFYFISTYIYIYVNQDRSALLLYSSILLCYVSFFLHCPLSGPVLIYISLLIISCIIEYVTNKRTLNLEPSDKRFRSMMTQTERLRRSFFPQAIRLLNSNSVS